MNPRTHRANQMLEKQDCYTQIDSNNFKVESQTDTTKSYIVSKTDNGLICTCKDHTTRKADYKHLKLILKVIKSDNDTFRVMIRSKLQLCKYCDSGRLKKTGMRKTKKGNVQRYACLDCKKRFTANFGFEKMRYDSVLITRVLQMYFSGMSVRYFRLLNKRTSKYLIRLSIIGLKNTLK